MAKESVRVIEYQEKEIARVIYHHHIDNLEFFTNDQVCLQTGIHNKPAGHKVRPHAHRFDPVVISRAEEVFYIIRGQVRVDLYDQNTGVKIGKVMLYTGDTMITYGHGHGLEFVKPTLLFEVKQGPFQGTEKSKIFL